MYLYAVPAFLVGCLAWAGDVAFLAVLASIVVGVCFRAVRRYALVAFVASPCIAPALLGGGRALAYWHSGAAAEWSRGRLLPFGHTSLDAVGRFYPIAVGGCLESVSEGVTNMVYNLGYNETLWAWTRIAGPPTGAYLGEVPSRETVLAALAEGSSRLGIGIAERGELLLEGAKISFDVQAVNRDLRPSPYSLVVARPDWFAITDCTKGWPGTLVIARSTGMPILYIPLEEEETTVLRRRWRALSGGSAPSG